MKQRKMAFAQQADKETVEITQRKLLLTRQELEDLKKQHSSLKRDYDTLRDK